MTDQSVQCDFPIVLRAAGAATAAAASPVTVNFRGRSPLRKHHTTEALHFAHRPWKATSPTSASPQHRARPQSLNIAAATAAAAAAAETLHRSKISFLSEGPRSLGSNGNGGNGSNHSIANNHYQQQQFSGSASTASLQQLSLPVITRERTPPSGSSSLLQISPSLSKFPSLEMPKPPSSCRCLCEDDYASNQRFVTSSTPEGLSWRRLHMSRAKLKATATTSELLSGFAMVAMVELQINEPTNVPEWLFVMFAVCTTVLVSVHIFALMISTYILPNIDAISKLDVCELVAESPHERMRGFIELAWAFSTVLGLFLFLVEVAILCWVKFWDYSFNAAIAATVVVLPVLVIFILFAVHFYHSLVVHRCDTSQSDLAKLEDMRKQLDTAENPV